VIRAVFDASVLVSGIISPHGPPAALLRAWRSGEFDMVVCPTLIAELERALSYPKLARYLSEAEATRLIDAFTRAALPAPDPEDVPKVCRDPDDDYLFAVARLHADVLVSGDKDILDVEEPGVRVFTPSSFSELLRTRWN
jgi:uncharacterized protein